MDLDTTCAVNSVGEGGVQENSLPHAEEHQRKYSPMKILVRMMLLLLVFLVVILIFLRFKAWNYQMKMRQTVFSAISS